MSHADRLKYMEAFMERRERGQREYKESKEKCVPSETSSDCRVRVCGELQLGSTAHIRQNQSRVTLYSTRKRAGASAPIIEKLSPVEENVVSSTPEIFAPSAVEHQRMGAAGASGHTLAIFLASQNPVLRNSGFFLL